MKALTLVVIKTLRQFFFKTFLEFSKAFKSRVSKRHIQLSLAVKNLVCFIYFKELLKIGARLRETEQVLQIGAKLLQIEAAPVVTNRGNSYYKSGKFQLLEIVAKLLQIGAELLQIGAIITNRCRAITLADQFLDVSDLNTSQACVASSPVPVVSSSSNNFRTNLPKLIIKQFDGDILNWQTFWDQYYSSVHIKTNISEIDKFMYLKSLL